VKGSKPPGWDYWGKRPLGHHMRVRGTKNKRIGIKRERRILNRRDGERDE
jgi:hypothetical protein